MFLGCVLARDSIWTILEFFCGLTKGSYREVKCGFLWFWFGKRENRRMMELFEVK